MANMNKNKNKNKKSSKGKETQVEEPRPLPTAKPFVLSSAVQAAANGIGPASVLVLGRVGDKKIAETSPPDNRRLVFREITKDNNAPDDIYRVISIPPKYADRPHDPDGHAECIITSDDQKRLFDCPLFLTERVPRAKPNTITIKKSATGGLGMFATRNITYAELLFAERPLLVDPAVRRSRFHPGEGRTLQEHLKITSFEGEQQLESAFRRMDDDKKDAYMALANSIKGGGPLSGRQQTNAYGIDLNKLTRNGGVVPESDELRRNFAAGVGLMPLEPKMYTFTGKNASRVNHSCSPNAEFDMSLGSFSIQFHAMRDIKLGEEIFVSYTGVYVPAAERRERLAPYGFTCVCTACSRATPELDKFRQTSASEMKKLDASYHTAKEYDQKRNNGKRLVREIILTKVLEFRSKLREEGLGVMSGPYLRSTLLLHDLHEHLGMSKEPEAKRVVKDMMEWMAMKARVQGLSHLKTGRW